MLLGMGQRAVHSSFCLPQWCKSSRSRTRRRINRQCGGLGWDIDSSYSSPRGELFPIGSYGHTGFTGTSIWIDPASRTYVILLTNYIHPKSGKKKRSLNALRQEHWYAGRGQPGHQQGGDGRNGDRL